MKQLTWQFFKFPKLISPLTGHALIFQRYSTANPNYGVPINAVVLGGELLFFCLFDTVTSDWSDEVWSSVDGINWSYKESIPAIIFTRSENFPVRTAGTSGNSAIPATVMSDGSVIIPLKSNYFPLGFLIRDRNGNYSVPLITPVVTGTPMVTQGQQLTAAAPANNGLAGFGFFGVGYPNENQCTFCFPYIPTTLGAPDPARMWTLSLTTTGDFTYGDGLAPLIVADVMNASYAIQSAPGAGNVGVQTNFQAAPVGNGCVIAPQPLIGNTSIWPVSSLAYTRDGQNWAWLPPIVPPETSESIVNYGAPGWWPVEIGSDLAVFITNSPDPNVSAGSAYGVTVYGLSGWGVVATPAYKEIYNVFYYDPCSPSGCNQFNGAVTTTLSGNVAPNGLQLAGRTWFFDPVGADAEGRDLYGAASLGVTDPQVNSVAFASTRNFVLSKRALAYYQRIGFVRLLQEYL